jgi:hypothetical protein
MSERISELIPNEIIRTETALSRFPIHRLSKSGDVSIEIKVRGTEGELTTKWKVKNPPDPISYKLDTLIVNRKIEEAGKPIPKLIRLGSLSEIASELGLKNTRNTEHIKNALIQNVGAVITAKFIYKTKTGEEKTIEIADTRYGAIFTGEELPDGRKADAVYIILHDVYRDILNSAPTRPLDYDYLKELSPMAQRFYELVSYKMFAALKYHKVAKLLYSEFCTYAPQTRFYDWEQVRPQMYRLHKPHLASGYIESIRFEQQRADDGTLDWMFIYEPGRKAKGEHSFATRKGLPKTKMIRSNPDQPSLLPPDTEPDQILDLSLSFTFEEEMMISQMKDFGVTESRSRRLVKSHREGVGLEILYFPYRDLSNVKNEAALFITAVLEGYPAPDRYRKLAWAGESWEESQNRKKAEQEKDQNQQAAEIKESDRLEQVLRRFDELPEDEKQKLSDEAREEILQSSDFKNANAATKKQITEHINAYIRKNIMDKFYSEAE